MGYKAILENAGTSKYVSDYYKNQEISNNAIEDYLHQLELVPQCYKTLKLCDKCVMLIPLQ